MPNQRTNGYPVLIIGAGRGGLALLEMFLADDLVKVVGMADSNPDAPGLKLAAKYRIPCFSNAVEAMESSSHYEDCIVYNLSHDDSIADHSVRIFGDQRVSSGHEVKLFWQMVTNMKAVKDELEKSQEVLQSVIRNVMDGIITINEKGEIQGFNPAAEKIFLYTQDEIRGRNVSILMPEPFRHEHDGYINRYLQTGVSRLLGVSGREVKGVRKNGEVFPLEISISEMMLSGTRYFVGITRDITDRKLAEEKIEFLAHYDYLTELPNRTMFMESIELIKLMAIRNKYKVAVMFLDLDGFKNINDTLGHDAGDLLLKQVAKRLTGLLRASDTVSRLGGDEFIFVLNDIESHEDVAMVANKVIATLALPFDLNGQQGHIGGSIGISIFPEDGNDFNGLIKQADEAMYAAKQGGKNTYRFYQGEWNVSGHSEGATP